jgi:alpha-amylase
MRLLEKTMSSNDVVTNSNVILHAFDWPYERVAQHAEQIKAAGYQTVLVSPPMKSFYQGEDTQWWQLYQPQDYRLIDNKLGNTLDFKHMMLAAKKAGLWVYVDVVFNHMANESGHRLDLQYPCDSAMKEYHGNADVYQTLTLFGDLSEPLFTEEDFVEAFGITNWQDRWEVQNGRLTGGPNDPGLPTLRTNENVVLQQQAYLNALKALGVRGFRIDAAKHLTVEHIKQVFTEEITEGLHVFGEIITDGGATKQEYELFLEPYLQETRLAAYDFPLFNTVFDAFSEKGSLTSLIDPYCFGQSLKHSRSITFAITHDIPCNDVFKNLVLPESSEWLAYTYILCRDGGVPLVYSDLNPSGITNSTGKPRWLDAWKDEKLVKLIEFHNQFHGLPASLVEANDDLLVFTRGENGVVAINKSSKTRKVRIASQESGIDILNEQEYPSINGVIELEITPKSSSVLIIQH